ncbi:hypothetical protein AUQ39_11950 [Lacticaseibacillus casei]|uniref:Uncharacterized protein n=1 Tax=Lacticaseibacillus zeae TaxID=57037 RepID=A0A5R8LY95_LACZE|nr:MULTISPECIES: hypothetical protein [Lacticaseibacillus]KLI74582.1 hypothetical protein AAW28_13220 [Lacticaseibacillus casei]OLS05637.1 hypothetical protein AUQ39_11950 [Lacticaseibacillus casei]QVI32474.1 hypothetical protein KG087_02205 [Lacticaseibacillus zeae]TLF42351.1 hypothetical protein FEI14_05510 [Lacticaseibacillus zeae]
MHPRTKAIWLSLMTIILVLFAFALFTNARVNKYREHVIPMNQRATLTQTTQMRVFSASQSKNAPKSLKKADQVVLNNNKRATGTYILIQTITKYAGSPAHIALNVDNSQIYQPILPGTSKTSTGWQYLFYVRTQIKQDTQLLLSVDNPKVPNHSRNIFVVHPNNNDKGGKVK